MELLGDDAVSDETRRHGDLESQPVLGHADVKHISFHRSVMGSSQPVAFRGNGPCVCGASCSGVSYFCCWTLSWNGVRLPSFSSVLSISSLEMPKPSQYPMCRSISRRVALTMLADCHTLGSAHLSCRTLTLGRLTAAISFNEPALYDASALARVKCICLALGECLVQVGKGHNSQGRDSPGSDSP